MVQIQSTLDLDQKLANLVEVVLTLRGRMPNVPISIEIPQGEYSDPYVVFTQQSLGPLQAEYLKELCENHSLAYHIGPLDGKLSVSLTSDI